MKITDFTDWLTQIFSLNERQWMTKVLQWMLDKGWQYQGDFEDIIEGFPLKFRKEGGFVSLSKLAELPRENDTGIELHHSDDAWQCAFSARSPFSTVFSALAYLGGKPEREDIDKEAEEGDHKRKQDQELKQ